MSQIDVESGAAESGGEGEWRVWRETGPISVRMSKVGKRVKESHSPCPQYVRNALLIAFVAETILQSGKTTCQAHNCV